MRERISESRYTFSINLPTSLYYKLVSKAGRGKVSTFIKQMLEEKLITEEKNQKEQLRKRLIEAYKREAKSKETQEEMTIWEGVASDSINDE